MTARRFVYLTHSLVSDWNHGNAHFQRGILSELAARGHDVVALEPANGWSRRNLAREQGVLALAQFATDFPHLTAIPYRSLDDIDRAVETADVVIVHEWTAPHVVAHLGRLRISGARFVLLFHDTHHRAISAPHEIDDLDLDGFDCVLAFGEILADTYRQRGWARQVVTWHEAADTRVFRPLRCDCKDAELVWIGNWGDNERAGELAEFLIGPVRDLGLSAQVFGVRYPQGALHDLQSAGIAYRGWIRNAAVPAAFAGHCLTVHVPRRWYATDLPGIPTIRMFEALACGIPLVSAPWHDAEGLFRAGEDFLMARTGEEMRRHLAMLLRDQDRARELARSGLQTIALRHTCAHRVDELLELLARVEIVQQADPKVAVA